jgi:predicted DNA-binding protein with PD1-like motif
MQCKLTDGAWILRLETGEEIIAAVKDFCRAKGITAGWVSGIGALSRATLGYFVRSEGVYIYTQLTGDHELISLLGNLSQLEGETFPHLHAALSGPDFAVRGGHLSEGVIAATGELVIAPLGGSLQRRLYPESGLKLLDLDA